jgi:serine/threonine protein kinase
MHTERGVHFNAQKEIDHGQILRSTRHIGPYEIDTDAPISEGGYGVVLGARDQASGLVAVKVGLLSAGNEHPLQSVPQEAAAHAHVNRLTPHVPTFIDAGEQDIEYELALKDARFPVVSTFPYIVMEHISGGTLHDRLDNGTLSLQDTVSVLTPPAQALDAMARDGLLHRDVKPGNIGLRGGTEGVLLDFGAVDEVGYSVDVEISGSPVYMVPEMVQTGAEVSERINSAQLGNVAYEAIVGEPINASRADNPAQRFREVFSRLQPGSYEDLVVDRTEPLHPYVRDVIRKAVATDPDDRFASAGDFVSALGEEADRIVLHERRRPVTIWMHHAPRARAEHADLATL